MIRSFSVFGLIAVLQVISSQSTLTDDDDDDYDGLKGPYAANDPRQGPFLEPYQELIPRHCWGPPPGVSLYECCPIPQVFNDEDLATCGIEKRNPENPSPPGKYADEEFGPKSGYGPNHGPHNGRRSGKWCSHAKCLMKIKGLQNDAEELDYVKLRKLLEDWGKANPDYEDAAKIAIGKCVKEGGPVVKHGKCTLDKIFFCVASTILWNCKLRKDLEQCLVLQEHMDECRPYYKKPVTQKE